MFTHMIHVKTEIHKARDNEYQLIIYQMQETGEYRIYIAKNGFGIGDIFTASQKVVSDTKIETGKNVIDELIKIAKSDIDKNEYKKY